MNITPRIKEISEEAAENMTISLINSDERKQLADIYREGTGDEIDTWCEACVFKAALYVYNNLI